jgi:hypothetical protein
MKYRACCIHSYGVESQTKLKVIIGQYEEGGLKMPHIEYVCHGLKMVWVNKILDPLTMAPWKTLYIDQYSRYGAVICKIPRYCKQMGSITTFFLID